MKKQLALFCLFLCFSSKTFSQTTIVWDGGGATNNFSEAANWVGDVLPQPGESVQFDNTSSKNCDFDGSASIDIVDLTITTGYTGTIDGLSSTPIINGSFSQAAGTFISTDDVATGMIVGHNMTLTGGTFTHNSGLINLAVDAGTSAISGAFTFNYVLISSNGTSAAQRNVDFGTSTTSTLELAGSSKIYGYQGNVSVTKELIISGSSSGSPASNTGTFTFSGAGPINIVGTGTAGQNRLSNINMNTSGLITMSGQISLTGDWAGTQGTLTVGSSTENFYGTAAISGTAAAFDNLTIQSSGVISMPSNAEVKVGGNLTRTGTLNFQTTTALGLNAPGSTSQSLAGGFTLAGLKAYGTGSSRNVTITGSMINILDSLKVGDHITFNTGGFITLKSSNSLTARVAEKPGTSSITGNVTVETFIPGGTTGWANLGVRGISGQTFNDWDTYVSSGGTTGIPMSCTGCVYSPTVIGTGSNSFVSVQGWDENADSYTELTASDPLTAGSGFWVYVGDGLSTTNGLTLVNSGSLVQNNVNITVSTSGTNAAHYNLVSNPYACPISWSKVIADGSNALSVSDVIYVYNADISATTSYVGATNASSHGSGGITDVIPGGQGFYVEALSTGFGNLAINETMKTFSVTGNTSANPLLRESGVSKTVQLFRLRVKGSSDWDETAFVTYPDATQGFDKKFDARKFFQSPGYSGYPGVYTKYTTISSRDAVNEDYSINTVAPLSTSLSIPVLVKVSATGTYTISAKDFQNFNTCVGLIDKLDNSYHDLRANPYVCNINDTTSAPRFELVLCRDPYVDLVSVPELENSGSILINQDQQGAYVKTVFTQSTKAVISAYNILGQKLMSDLTVEGLGTTTRLNLDLHNQVAIIKVTTDKETSTKKIVLH